MRITELTALTKLELKHYESFPSLDPLHSLHLREVRFINCFFGDWPTLEASAFPVLQSLHIEDSEGFALSAAAEPSLERTLDRIGRELCSMPHLVSLSGNSVLLGAARIGSLHPAWQLSAASQHTCSGIYSWERIANP